MKAALQKDAPGWKSPTARLVYVPPAGAGLPALRDSQPDASEATLQPFTPAASAGGAFSASQGQALLAERPAREAQAADGSQDTPRLLAGDPSRRLSTAVEQPVLAAQTAAATPAACSTDSQPGKRQQRPKHEPIPVPSQRAALHASAPSRRQPIPFPKATAPAAEPRRQQRQPIPAPHVSQQRSAPAGAATGANMALGAAVPEAKLFKQARRVSTSAPFSLAGAPPAQEASVPTGGQVALEASAPAGGQVALEDVQRSCLGRSALLRLAEAGLLATHAVGFFVRVRLPSNEAIGG
jgi:hypothetical protein